MIKQTSIYIYFMHTWCVLIFIDIFRLFCSSVSFFRFLHTSKIFSSTFGENKHVSKPLQLKPLCSRANCISYETSQGWVAGLRIWIILHFGPHDISSHPYKQSQGANIFQVFILQPLIFTILYTSRHSIFTEMSCSSLKKVTHILIESNTMI